PLHEHAHQADKLTLPHAELRAALAYVGLQAVGQRVEPFAAPDAVGNLLDLLVRRLRAGIAHVVHDRAAEQERRLRHQPQPAAVALQVKAADVSPVNQDPPALKLIEAGDQLGDGAL